MAIRIIVFVWIIGWTGLLQSRRYVFFANGDDGGDDDDDVDNDDGNDDDAGDDLTAMVDSLSWKFP